MACVTEESGPDLLWLFFLVFCATASSFSFSRLLLHRASIPYVFRILVHTRKEEGSLETKDGQWQFLLSLFTEHAVSPTCAGEHPQLQITWARASRLVNGESRDRTRTRTCDRPHQSVPTSQGLAISISLHFQNREKLAHEQKMELDPNTVVRKRLHVAGLTPAVSTSDSSQGLGNPGTIVTVDGIGALDGLGRPRPFAYVTIEAKNSQLTRCTCFLTVRGVSDVR